MDAIEILPSRCHAAHPARNAAKLAAIASSMRDQGWTGDPLLGVGSAEDCQLLTGSHRLEAARRAGLPSLPVRLLTEEELSVARTDPAWDPRYDRTGDTASLEVTLRDAGLLELADLLAEPE